MYSTIILIIPVLPGASAPATTVTEPPVGKYVGVTAVIAATPATPVTTSLATTVAPTFTSTVSVAVPEAVNYCANSSYQRCFW